jgi:hypothetical protein
MVRWEVRRWEDGLATANGVAAGVVVGDVAGDVVGDVA